MVHEALRARGSGDRSGPDPLLVEGWTLYALGVCVVLTRLVTRYKMVGVEGSKPDDWLMILAMVNYYYPESVTAARLTD